MSRAPVNILVLTRSIKMSAVQTFRGPLRNNMHKQINSMSADTLSHVRLDNGDKKTNFIIFIPVRWGVYGRHFDGWLWSVRCESWIKCAGYSVWWYSGCFCIFRVGRGFNLRWVNILIFMCFISHVINQHTRVKLSWCFASIDVCLKWFVPILEFISKCAHWFLHKHDRFKMRKQFLFSYDKTERLGV